jgi:phosphoglycolate phosphatase-like HAD superfamily hydrolase
VIAILDVDGTLVDTNYHHTLAWYRAFVQNDVEVSAWRVHRHIGMGGDKMIEAVAGPKVERDKGDDIRVAEKYLYGSLMPEVRAMPGARRLIEALAAGGHRVLLASSAKPEEAEAYVDLLDVADLVEGRTDSSDVEETKPAPDLVIAAMEKAGAHEGDHVVMVGDSVWDCLACRAAGVECWAVLTGGFSIEELKKSGAARVHESLGDLTEAILSP